jgi:hypothetical protein
MATAAMPSYADLRRRVADLMLERGEWAGCPMPIEGLRLHIEPTYPYQELADLLAKKDEPADDDLNAEGLRPGGRLVNTWYSERKRAYVFLVQDATGRAQAFVLPQERWIRRLDISILGAQASWAHDVTAEITAMRTLSEHTTEEQMRQYWLLGQFIETSKRSGVTYVFRRVRPTIALRPMLHTDRMHVLAVLCMHPIAYYRDTTVGAMTPTDDVLAHLLLMRGDEAMFWRRCNQHRPEDPEAML